MNTMEEFAGEQEVVLYDKQTPSLEFLRDLAYHELEKVISEARRVKYDKYPCANKKGVLCPNLRKSFPTRESLIYFFQTMNTKDSLGRRIPKESASKLLLLKQFFYCLRTSEVNDATLNPYTRLVRVRTLKQGRECIHYIPFIEGTERLFECPKVHPAVLQKVFRQHLHNLGGMYPEIYHLDKNGHNLHRLNPTSLRVTSSNLLRSHTRDPYKQKVFLRHSINRVYGAMSHYAEYDEEEFRRDLNACFKPFVDKLL